MSKGRRVALSLDFFDSNLFIGQPTKAPFKPVCTTAELLDEMDARGIGRALVWHIAQHDSSPPQGNRMLAEAIAGCDRLFGCWTILPPQTGEVIHDSFFQEMEENGVYALRAFPDLHRFILDQVAFGGFFENMIARKIPLFLSPENGISWRGIYDVLRDAPELTCVICDIGIWGAGRHTWPLLERYPNVYVETSLLSLEAGGMESTVERFGAGRLLFGSGFPARYPEAAMLQLTHAQIAQADKQKIAHENLARLLAEVKL